MKKSRSEAILLAAVHLCNELQKGKIETPKLKYCDKDEFDDYIGHFHDIVKDYEDAIEKNS